MGNCGYRYWRILILKILVKKMFIKKIILSLILFSSIITKINCQDGSLDSTFGPNQNGTVITPPSAFIPVTSAAITSIALQSTGKIIASGEAGLTTAAVARYTTSGILDTTFGTNGTTTITPPGVTLMFASYLAIQTDDKIVVGINGLKAGVQQFIVARLNPNGTLDTSFGSGGSTSLLIGTNSFITSIKIQSDGKIVAAGQATVSGVNQFAIARFNSDGSLDTSFGSPNGFVTFQIPGSTTSQINAIAIQSDGKIVASGQATIGGVVQFTVARFNSDGSLDTSFGNNGVFTFPLGTASAFTAVSIQSDNKIVLGGIAATPANEFTLIRLQTNGTRDTSFGNAGIAIVPLSTFGSGTTSANLFSIAIQSDGKIVAGGEANPGGVTTFALARFTTNGILDNSFGQNGTVTVLPLTIFGPNPSSAVIANILIQPDGKIVAGGHFSSTTLSYFALARFNVTIGCFTNLTQAIIEKYGI